MRAVIKLCVAASVLLLNLPSALAQDGSASFDGTLKKRAAALADLLDGRYANTEQVSFAKTLTPDPDALFETRYELTIESKETGLAFTSNDALLPEPATATLEVTRDALSFKMVADRFACIGDVQPLLSGFVVSFGKGSKRCPFGDQMTVLADGLHVAATKQRPALHLARSNAFSCWVAMPKRDKSWFFQSKIPMHDQGGWAWIETDEDPAQRVGLRMRQAIWPYGSSKPSLVLYVHKEGDEERAASYAWADPDAKRVGINIRWMQGSCSKVAAD